jgi:hypothetical protein
VPSPVTLTIARIAIKTQPMHRHLHLQTLDRPLTDQIASASAQEMPSLFSKKGQKSLDIEKVYLHFTP